MAYISLKKWHFDFHLTPADSTWSLHPILHHFGFGVLPTKYGIHRAFPEQFDTWLTSADPCMTFDPINALLSVQGFFLLKFGSHWGFMCYWRIQSKKCLCYIKSVLRKKSLSNLLQSFIEHILSRLVCVRYIFLQIGIIRFIHFL